MSGFLASAIFQYFVFPIGSAILGIYIKYVSRNDQYAKFKKEDLAVGLELLLTAFLTFIVLTTNRALLLKTINKDLTDALQRSPVDASLVSILQAKANEASEQLTTAPWLILLMFMTLWVVSTIVRKWGWQSETELRLWFGIALPLAIGVAALIAVMAEVAQ